MAPDERPDPQALAALVELRRRTVVKPHGAAELERGLTTLRARVAGERARRPVLVRGVVLGATMVLVLLGAARLIPAFRTPAGEERAPVAVERIEGGSLLDGGYLAESAHAGVKLFFSEGTRFVLMPGTRGRLREVTRDGAALSIENGAASFQVTPDPSRRWSIEAGPFLVTVKGTVFDVSWDPESEQFDLTLRRGRVVVSGPLVGGSVTLHAGQHLSVRLPLAETIVTDTAIDQTAPASPGAPAPPARLPAPKRLGARAASLPQTPALNRDAPGWQSLLAAGQWDRILAEAQRSGVETTLERAPSEDLFALADAARYRHRADVARAALLAQRRRFPDSPRSLDAIFLLGRVAELRDGGATRALALYDEYLARAPQGPYAAEALGRKMILLNDEGDAGKARRLAREYLLRFPSGSYVTAARALTGAQ